MFSLKYYIYRTATMRLMKNVFFISGAIVFFALISFRTAAQDTAEKKSVASTIETKQPPKFIDNIELVPPGSSATQNTAIKDTVVGKPVSVYVNPDSSYAIENCSPLQFKYAILTDRNVEDITDTPLYNFIDNWMGTRYRYGGTDSIGIDCSSFAAKLMQQIFNVSLPRTSKEQYLACSKLNRDDLKEGDLVFFDTRGGVSHVGVYLGNNYFVHSSVRGGVMINSLDEDYYRDRFISGGRVY